ncbi:glycerophosphoryl diester phosphodiesterase membrane domain-containing protein [Evansella sp. AB-P1]|uniref:glycerophosphoryl diester phosphodiesterase membrane domain-containing protein n=1 Tax=Evansella sp. AB-P1 TaxID=3037653 RepID=UPI00241F1D52|nr:glycerophosphodiester phosphodiesterase family protein [Evansella sp. AB-P1]MDG5786769.1 glycerophosphoryl diester phosphodiesterase membrane domain-containing protein [Evansella sp. AB-P1]
MFEVVRKSWRDFKASYRQYLSFTLIFMVLTSLLFVPLISFIFNRILQMIGAGSLLNAEVYRIGLSTAGFIGMLIISFLVVIILLIEFGVMITLAQKRYFNKKVLVSEAFFTTLKKLPSLLGFGMLQLIFVFLLIIPFISSAGLPALLDFNLPIFLTNQLYGLSMLSILIYILVLFLVISFIIRLLFTLHYIFIEETSIWTGMKRSWRLTKGNKLKLIIKLVLLNLVIFLIGFVFVTFLSYIPRVTDAFLLGYIIEDYLLTFASYMMILFSLLLIPMNVIILTRSFFRFRKNQGEAVVDHVTIYGNRRLTALENRIVRFFTKRRFTLSFVIFFYVTGMFAVNYNVNDNIVYLKWNVQVAAHRGDVQNAPENSMSAILSAIEKGVDAVEFDVMLTMDGQVILNHDDDLQRVAGVPRRVDEMTYEELAEVDIGRLYSDEFIGEGIPTLDEVLEEIQGENVNLIVDVKVLNPSRNRELAEGIVESIETYDFIDNAYVQAFDYNVLQEVRQLNSDIKIGQILFLSAGDLSRLDVDFYTIRQTMLSERFVSNARRQNREVWVWTVNLERNIREVLKYDIDGIITSYPERVMGLVPGVATEEPMEENRD